VLNKKVIRLIHLDRRCPRVGGILAGMNNEKCRMENEDGSRKPENRSRKSETRSQKGKTSAAVQADRDFLVRQFRAHLHLAITAQMIGGEQALEARQGAAAVRFCRALVYLPEAALVRELAYPVKALLEEVKDVATPYALT